MYKGQFTYFQDVFLQGLDVSECLWVLVNNYHLLQWILKYTQTLQLVISSSSKSTNIGLRNQHHNHIYTMLGPVH